MASLFGRLKTWGRERLRYNDLNGEVDNIISNMNPDGINGAGDTAGAFQAASDPAPAGVVSLPTSLRDEIKRIRFVLQALTGGTYWYDSLGTSIATSASGLFGYAPNSGLTAAEALVDYLHRGGLLNALSLSAADVATGDFDGTNKKFGNYAMKVKGSTVFALPGKAAQSMSLSAHFRNLAAGDYVAYNPHLGIELYLDGSGFLTARVREQTAASETAKTFNTVAGGASRAADTDFQHVVLRVRVNAVGGATTDLVNLLLDGANEGAQVNGTSIPMGVGDGGVWFIGARPNDPTWGKFSAMSVLPNLEASSPWTLTTVGTPTPGVSGGVLSLQADFGDTILYERTTGVDLANMTIDAKVFVGGANAQQEIQLCSIHDTSMSRKLAAYVQYGVLQVSATGSSVVRRQIPLATNQWNTIRITSLGSPDPIVRVYVNGVQVCVFENSEVEAAGADYFAFGLIGAVSSGAYTAQFEHYAYISSVAATVYPPVQSAPATTGQIDDVLLSEEQLSAALITQLGNYPASQVYKLDYKRGLQMPAHMGMGIIGGGAAARLGDMEAFIVSDGLTPLHMGITAHLNTTFTPAYLYTLLALVDEGAESSTLQSVSTQYLGAGVQNAIILSGTRVLPIGVHRLVLSASGFNGGDTLIGGIVPFVRKVNEEA